MESVIFSSKEDFISQTEDNKKSYIIFAGYDLIKNLAEVTRENVILCSTSGEFTPKGYSDSAITGFSYDPKEAEIVEIDHPPVKSLRALKSAYDKVKSNNNAFALLLCDGLSAMEESIITTLYFIKPEFKIIGGSSGDNLKFKETLIYSGNKKVHSIAVFFDSSKKTQIIKENLYVPIGKKMLVTEADPITRTVKKFNNRPAASEYSRLLGISEEELSKYFMSNPLGRKVNSEINISSPMKINGDGSITFYCQIVPNTFVEILEIADYEKVLEETLNKISISPSFTLSINCILRSLHFIENRMWNQVSEGMLSVCRNQTGFISYGEQYYKNHFNQTMVMLLVE